MTKEEFDTLEVGSIIYYRYRNNYFGNKAYRILSQRRDSEGGIEYTIQAIATASNPHEWVKFRGEQKKGGN